MAWRIESAIVRGEIDNTIEGITTGKLWLIHQQEPVTLLLQGNCLRDLAGAKLTFVNPHPAYTQTAPELSFQQMGLVGDLTASRKCKIYENIAESDVFCWKNVLYLEWFDHVNGRVLIETADFELSLDSYTWQQTSEMNDFQKSQNQLAMRNFINTFIQRSSQADLWSEENADEFAWEQRLKESDRLSDAFQEVIEKYSQESDSQEKQAFAMGWDSMLGILPEDDVVAVSEEQIDAEKSDLLENEWFSEDEESWDEELDDEHQDLMEEDDEDFDDWDDDYIIHPLQLKAHDTANAALELLSEFVDSRDSASRLCSQLMQVAGKLAVALNNCGEEIEQEAGYVLAILKRCLYWLNDAIAACQELLDRVTDETMLAGLKQIWDSIFQIRNQITDMRRELKHN